MSLGTSTSTNTEGVRALHVPGPHTDTGRTGKRKRRNRSSGNKARVTVPVLVMLLSSVQLSLLLLFSTFSLVAEASHVSAGTSSYTITPADGELTLSDITVSADLTQAGAFITLEGPQGADQSLASFVLGDGTSTTGYACV